MELITVPEAAARARVSRRTIQRLIASGKGPPLTVIGRRHFLASDSFETWLRSLAQPPRDNPPGRPPRTAIAA